MITMYGIKNCDTIKKARKFLEESNTDYKFHDFKKEGLDRDVLSKWVDELGWEVLVNKRGTTWRKLSSDVQDSIVDGNSAINLMLENLSIIKRPVLKVNGEHVVGFDADKYKEAVR